MKTYLLRPEKAKWHMACTPPHVNRPLRDNRINELAEIIKSGNWSPGPDLVVFGPNGEVLNGQHRVAACARAGIPILINVAEPGDVDPAHMATWDTGAPRTNADNLWIKGYADNVPTLSSAAGFVWMYDHYGVFDTRRPTSDELMVFMSDKAKSDALQESVAFAIKYARKLQVAPAIFGSLHFLFRSSNRAQADVFFNDLLNKEYPPNSYHPIPMIRRKLLGVSKAERLKTIPKFRFIIKAFNCFLEGRTIRAFQEVQCKFAINGRPPLNFRRASDKSGAPSEEEELTYTPNSGVSIRDIINRSPEGGSFLVNKNFRASVYPPLSTLGYSVSTEEINHFFIRVRFRRNINQRPAL